MREEEQLMEKEIRNQRQRQREMGNSQRGVRLLLSLPQA